MPIAHENRRVWLDGPFFGLPQRIRAAHPRWFRQTLHLQPIVRRIRPELNFWTVGLRPPQIGATSHHIRILVARRIPLRSAEVRIRVVEIQQGALARLQGIRHVGLHRVAGHRPRIRSVVQDARGRPRSGLGWDER